MIAANIDTLFVVTSCNADFNPARLERYLALAKGAGVEPVILLTKADLAADLGSWRDRAEAIDRRVAVRLLDARAPDPERTLGDWCRPGQTVALVGSSGRRQDHTRECAHRCGASHGADPGGRRKGPAHDNAEAPAPVRGGGWLIDTPGMRELRLTDAMEGIAAVFDDIDQLVHECRFSDCTHRTEPGCAVQAAVEDGRLEKSRLARWEKLKREDRHNSETLAEAHARNRAFGKIARTVLRDKSRRGGRH